MKTDTLLDAIQPPRVGALAAIAHISNSKSQLEQFLAQINQAKDSDCLPHETLPPQLAISIEQHRIHMTTKKEAVGFDTDHYRFVVSFAAGTSLADVASAFRNGALAQLASIQLQVGLVNQMVGAGYAVDSWELQTVLDDISQDAKAIGRIVAEGQQLRLSSDAAPSLAA